MTHATQTNRPGRPGKALYTLHADRKAQLAAEQYAVTVGSPLRGFKRVDMCTVCVALDSHHTTIGF